MGKWRREMTPGSSEDLRARSRKELRELGYETVTEPSSAGAPLAAALYAGQDVSHAGCQLRPPAARPGARPGGALRHEAKAGPRMALNSKPVQRALKRVADPILALVALVLLSPFFLVVAVLIVAESGRPVFFVYPRAGRDGRPFRMFKFRTMVQDAIEVGRATGLSKDPFGVVKDDPRVTRIGRWLRRTGLDELPQLGNVLTGRMSLVGPRADLVEQAANYGARERRRLDVLPGITGWAQIHGRDSVSWPERFELDLWYLDHWSLWLDFKIVLGTFRELFRTEPNPVEDTMNIERARAAGGLAEISAEDWDELLLRVGCADTYLRRDYLESATLLDEGEATYLHLDGPGGDVVFACIVAGPCPRLREAARRDHPLRLRRAGRRGRGSSNGPLLRAV